MNDEIPLRRDEWRRIHSVNQSQKKAAEARTKLLQVKAALEVATRDIENCIQVEYTGWCALLKKTTSGGWECLAIVDSHNPPEDELEWDLCLPIPDPQTIPEFGGW